MCLKVGLFGVRAALPFLTLVIGLRLPVANDSLARDVCNPFVGLTPSVKFAVII